MNYTIKNIIFALFIWLISCSYVWAAPIENANVQQGINEFFSAQFEQAVQTLQNALSEEDLNQSDFFAAHLYTAFAKIRLNYMEENINMHLREAVKASPHDSVDWSKIPPDLLERYHHIRQNVTGTLFVESVPSSASAVLVHLDSERIQSKKTPAQFENLFPGRYSLVISQQNYKAFTRTIDIKTGINDSITVSLEKAQKSLLQAYWPYGAGALVIGAVILSKTFGDEPSEEKIFNLPTPPKRPEN